MTFKNEKEVSTLETVVALAIAIIGIITFSYTFTYIWNLFLVPLNVIPLTPLYTYALTLVLACVQVAGKSVESINNQVRNSPSEVVRATFIRMTAYGLLAGIAWIVSKFLF